MRIVLAFLVAVLVNSTYAYAAPVSFGAGRASRGESHVPSLQTIRVQIESMATGNLVDFSIPGLTPADAGMTWSITADNAAAYGLDWSAVMPLIGNPVFVNTRIYMSSIGEIKSNLNSRTVCEPWRCIYDFELERIDVSLGEFYTSPVGYRKEYSALLVGTARVVPEPTALALLALALCALCSSLRRRRHLDN